MAQRQVVRANSSEATTQSRVAHAVRAVQTTNDPVLKLQQTIGNRATQRLIQQGSEGARPIQRDDDESWLGSIGDAVSSVGSSIASGVSSAVDAGEGLVSDAGSAIASGAKSVAGDVSDVAGEAWQGAKSVAGDVADFGKDVYGQMKEDAGYVQQGVGLVGKGIDWAEDEAKSGTGWLADKAKGIPVLEQVADAGKSFVDTSVDVTGGALKGVTGMAGGILSAAADPVDTAKALYTMSEHIPGMGLPQKMLSGAYDLAFTDKSVGDVANETLNPMEDAKYWGNMAKGLWSPLQQSINAGKPGEALGQAGVQIAAMFTGAGEAGVAGEAAEGAEAAQAAEAAEAAEGAEAAGKLGPTKPPPEGYPDVQWDAPTKPVAPDPHVYEIPPEPAPPDLGPYRTPGLPGGGGTAEGLVEGPAPGVEATAPSEVGTAGEQSTAAGKSMEGALAPEASPAEASASGELETGAGGSGGGTSSGGSPSGPDVEQMVDDVQAGRNARVRAQSPYADIRVDALKEEIESGIRSPDTEMLAEDRGANVPVEIAEGETSLGEAQVNVHHKTSLAEAPELAANEENLELLNAQGRGSAHAAGAHGNQFATPRGGLAADPGFEENLGMSGDQRRLVDSETGQPVPGLGESPEKNLTLEEQGNITARPKEQSLEDILNEQAQSPEDEMIDRIDSSSEFDDDFDVD